MFKVFEDKVTITKSEFEEYIQMKKDREVIDKMTRFNYSVSNDLRLALGLDPVDR